MRLIPRLFRTVLLGLGLALFMLFPVIAADLPTLAIVAPSQEMAAEVRAISAKIMPSLARLTGASPGRIKIVVTGSKEEYEGWMKRLGAPAWAAGVAVPGQGLVVLRSPGQLTQPGEFTLVLAHELTHIYLHNSPQGIYPPLWLEEGIAMYASQSGGLGLTSAMAAAVLGGKLIPFARLKERFPKDQSQAGVAYAQSYYFLSFIMKEYGPEAIPRVLAEMARGREATQALTIATGKGLAELEKDFLEAMESRFSWLSVLTAGGTLWGLAAIVAAVGLVLRRRAQVRARRRLPDVDLSTDKETRRVEFTSPRKNSAKTPPGPDNNHFEL